MRLPRSAIALAMNGFPAVVSPGAARQGASIFEASHDAGVRAPVGMTNQRGWPRIRRRLLRNSRRHRHRDSGDGQGMRHCNVRSVWPQVKCAAIAWASGVELVNRAALSACRTLPGSSPRRGSFIHGVKYSERHSRLIWPTHAGENHTASCCAALRSLSRMPPNDERVLLPAVRRLEMIGPTRVGDAVAVTMLKRPRPRRLRHLVRVRVAVVNRIVAVVGEVRRVKKDADGWLRGRWRLLQERRRDRGLPRAVQDHHPLQALRQGREPRLPPRPVEDVAIGITFSFHAIRLCSRPICTPCGRRPIPPRCAWTCTALTVSTPGLNAS